MTDNPQDLSGDFATVAADIAQTQAAVVLENGETRAALTTAVNAAATATQSEVTAQAANTQQVVTDGNEALTAAVNLAANDTQSTVATEAANTRAELTATLTDEMSALINALTPTVQGFVVTLGYNKTWLSVPITPVVRSKSYVVCNSSLPKSNTSVYLSGDGKSVSISSVKVPASQQISFEVISYG